MRDLRRLERTSGFAMIELLMVVAIGATLAGMTVIATGSALRIVRGDSGQLQVMSQIRMARELAVNQRRAMQVQFWIPNEIRIVRQELPTGTTLVNQAFLEGNVQFLQFAGLPDTPDGFGASGPVDLGGATLAYFAADGMLVDASGTPVNGSVFLGVQDQLTTARAVTVFGGTGRVRGYTWNGTAWAP